MKSIPFNTDMIESLRAGRKTQTRRRAIDIDTGRKITSLEPGIEARAMYRVGEVVSVGETFREVQYRCLDSPVYQYKDSENDIDHDRVISVSPWKAPVLMPGKAARTFLRITNVRAEYLKDITENDAVAEGILPCSMGAETGYENYFKFEDNDKAFYPDNVKYFNFSEEKVCSAAVASFRSLWLSIYGGDAWKENPVVWVYEFDKL